MARELEDTIHRNLRDRLTYSGYLQLDRVLDAQTPLSEPHHHDEMLFIIQHQTSELWIKLILHELKAAVEHLRADRLEPCFKILARVKQVQQQMISQWSVLDTLTPSEYAQFRGILGRASGFQSAQYRQLEFILGCKGVSYLSVFEHDQAAHDELERLLHRPGLYDEFLRYLARRGHAVPAERVERDWTQAYEQHDGVVDVLKGIYEDTATHWDAYDMCEKLVDLEQNHQVWRFRHLKTVERIIGFKHGTGGSSGVAFLRRALDFRLFPELIDVRTHIEDL